MKIWKKKKYIIIINNNKAIISVTNKRKLILIDFGWVYEKNECNDEDYLDYIGFARIEEFAFEEWNSYIWS